MFLGGLLLFSDGWTPFRGLVKSPGNVTMSLPYGKRIVQLLFLYVVLLCYEIFYLAELIQRTCIP